MVAANGHKQFLAPHAAGLEDLAFALHLLLYEAAVLFLSAKPVVDVAQHLARLGQFLLDRNPQLKLLVERGLLIEDRRLALVQDLLHSGLARLELLDLYREALTAFAERRLLGP